MEIIYHIAAKVAWEKALTAGTYYGDTLETEGFIHCSTREQILDTANSYFRGQEGLVLLSIDASKVQSPVRYEDLYAKGQDFPHIYGPLNLDAVIHSVDFPPGKDGLFIFPAL